MQLFCSSFFPFFLGEGGGLGVLDALGNITVTTKYYKACSALKKPWSHWLAASNHRVMGHNKVHTDMFDPQEATSEAKSMYFENV